MNFSCLFPLWIPRFPCICFQNLCYFFAPFLLLFHRVQLWNGLEVRPKESKQKSPVLTNNSYTYRKLFVQKLRKAQVILSQKRNLWVPTVYDLHKLGSNKWNSTNLCLLFPFVCSTGFKAKMSFIPENKSPQRPMVLPITYHIASLAREAGLGWALGVFDTNTVMKRPIK